MTAGGFAGTTFGDQIERVYRNVMSNQRENVAALSTNYTAGSTTLTITGVAANTIQVGSLLAVEEEVFLVQSWVPATGIATVLYGYEGSSNVNHSSGTAVYVNPKYTRWAIAVALNDALASISAPGQGVMREAYTTVTFNPILKGYDLAAAGVPANFHTILSVRYDQPDPTHYFPEILRYRVGRGITSPKIPGGYALFLDQGAYPGLNLSIAYGAPFIPATSTSQDMVTDLGLPATALDIPAMKAEIDLTVVREIKRNFIEGQPDVRKSTDVVAGNIANSAQALVAHLDRRISEEADRFRQRWPHNRAW